MYGLTRCTKAQSCWRDFCRTSYAVCGLLCTTPAKMATESCHTATFSYSHCDCTVSVPTKTPSYWLLVMIYNPCPLKKASASRKFQGDTTKILLVASGE